VELDRRKPGLPLLARKRKRKQPQQHGLGKRRRRAGKGYWQAKNEISRERN